MIVRIFDLSARLQGYNIYLEWLLMVINYVLSKQSLQLSNLCTALSWWCDGGLTVLLLAILQALFEEIVTHTFI